MNCKDNAAPFIYHAGSVVPISGLPAEDVAVGSGTLRLGAYNGWAIGSGEGLILLSFKVGGWRPHRTRLERTGYER